MLHPQALASTDKNLRIVPACILPFVHCDVKHWNITKMCNDWLSACMGDNPLAKARGLSPRTGGQTMVQLQRMSKCKNMKIRMELLICTHWSTIWMVRNLIEQWTEKSVSRDQRLSSLGKPRDGKPVAVREGSGGSLESPPPFLRPNYFISMGYLRKKDIKSAKLTPTP